MKEEEFTDERIVPVESPSFRPSRRPLKGVIGNFLGAYTSRYSDFGGYWLFGFLCPDPALIQIDLLGDKSFQGNRPIEVARIIALDEFADQLAKARLPVTWLREAHLTITRGEQPIEQLAGGIVRRGYETTFDVDVTSDQGTKYSRKCARFVAPHDPSVERRSDNPRT